MDTASMISVGLSQTYDRNKIVEPSVSNPDQSQRWPMTCVLCKVASENESWVWTALTHMHEQVHCGKAKGSCFLLAVQSANESWPQDHKSSLPQKKNLFGCFSIKWFTHTTWPYPTPICTEVPGFGSVATGASALFALGNPWWNGGSEDIILNESPQVLWFQNPICFCLKSNATQKKGSACNSWELELFFTWKWQFGSDGLKSASHLRSQCIMEHLHCWQKFFHVLPRIIMPSSKRMANFFWGKADLKIVVPRQLIWFADTCDLENLGYIDFNLLIRIHPNDFIPTCGRL